MEARSGRTGCWRRAGAFWEVRLFPSGALATAPRARDRAGRRATYLRSCAGSRTARIPGPTRGDPVRCAKSGSRGPWPALHTRSSASLTHPVAPSTLRERFRPCLRPHMQHKCPGSSLVGPGPADRFPPLAAASARPAALWGILPERWRSARTPCAALARLAAGQFEARLSAIEHRPSDSISSGMLMRL